MQLIKLRKVSDRLCAEDSTEEEFSRLNAKRVALIKRPETNGEPS